MKILIFSMTYFPFVGGAEVAVKEITDRIGDMQAGRPPLTPPRIKCGTGSHQGGEKFEFDMITARLDKSLPSFERIGNIYVYRVGKGWILDKYLYPILAWWKAQELSEKENYDIVHAIMATWAGIAALFFKLTHKKVKYLLTEQSGDSDFFIWIRTWFWYPLYKMVYTKADYVQVISRWLEQRIRRYGYKGEIKIVPNGVDINKFKVKSQKSKVREQLGFADDDKIIITVSRLVKKNGVEDLVRAMVGLKSKVKSKKLVIVGTGNLEKKLKQLVSELSLQDSVMFLGNIGHDRLPQYLWASDIFCRPSLTEGFGNVFVEAMAAGLPVIATPVGGIVDFLKNEETGMFCQVRNPQSIAEAVVKLLNDKALYQKIVDNGLKMVEARYDWNEIAQEMKGVYEKLITE